MGPTDINTDVSHIAPLDADNIPNSNQAHYCFSCEEPMQGAFCIACGQKNDNMRRGSLSLIWELISSLTAIEGRIWRTWRSLLFQPGRVAREFANGRRTYWSSPIRVYLAMSILLFAFMGLTNTHLYGIDIDVTPKDGVTKAYEDLTAKDLDLKVSTQWFPRQKDIDKRNSDKNFDLIEKKLLSYTAQDILGEKDAEEIRDLIADANDEDDTASEDEDKPTFNIDDLNIKINNRKLDSKSGARLLINFAQNPVILTNSFNKWLPRLIFILMPFTVLFAAIFIRGRENAMLYDHLIHAAYLHAIAFLFLFLGVAFSQLFTSNISFEILFIILLIYLPISLKRMFKRKWLKTIWTSYGVGLSYMIVLLISLSLAITFDIGKNITV